jgi:serine/threonine protein kinase
VAVKVLHPDYARDAELVKRFDREAHSAARLDHPNCVCVIESGTSESGVKYIVMELLAGVELQELVHGPLEPRRAAELALQIVHGLEHAHGQGVVHRDLKPQNIFVTRDQEGRELLKLVDFGIAKIIHGDGSLEQMTRAGMAFGTPQYMSPEQALGLEIDARADLYAVGVLLYAFVAGRLPFNSDDLLGLVRMQVSTPPPHLPASVPPPLVAIIMRLLAKQKDDRFADATALREALERFRDASAAGNERSETLRNLFAGPAQSGSGSSSAFPDALRPRTLSGLHTTFLRRPASHRALALGGVLLLAALVAWWLL